MKSGLFSRCLARFTHVVSHLTRRGRGVAFCGVALLVLARGVAAADLDTDGDGVIDSEDPNPTNSRAVPWRALGSWRFSAGTLAGDEGQQPIAQTNVSIVPNGFQGPGVQLGAGAKVSLRYRAVEPSGKPNFAAARGSFLFRLKPNWSSGGGPGNWVTLLQTTNFAVRISPNGSSMVLTSLRAGSTVTNVQLAMTARRNNWSYGLLTYSPEESSLSFDAPSIRATGSGVSPPENFNSADHFLAIGSAADGTGSINGVMDEIVAFNVPGAIGLTPVAISAFASDNPPGLSLAWLSPTNTVMEVKRRAVGARGWDSTHAAIGTNYFDSSVIPGERYEYNVNSRVADLKTGLPDDSGRLIKASRAGAPIHERGKIILLIDKTLLPQILPELGGFMTNLVGDGWQILRADVPRHVDDYSAPSKFLTNYYNITNAITPFIRSNYARFGPEIKHILVIGHVPVPYSGTAADDGHTVAGASHGAHTGAWASDLFYGDVDGIWTDIQNVTSSTYSFNWNTPGDGKMDQNKIPANASGEALLEIPVARIDFANMPSFKESEAALLKRYFRKNADFRQGLKTFPPEAMTAEYVLLNSTTASEISGEILSKVTPLKSPVVGDLFMDRRSFLIGVQSGPGAFDRINDGFPNYQHTTADLANGLPGGNCAFIFLRGSYFPDWNTQDNFLRAVLTLPNGGLTVAGFFGKSWRAEGLAVGQTIGHDVAQIINTWSVPGNSIRWMEILGDPTLRYPILAPPGPPRWRAAGDRGVTVSWSAAPGAAAYYVYRSAGDENEFQRITSSAVSGTSYTDLDVPRGRVVYMVRAAGMATTGAGTFTNLSQGVFTAEINADNL